LPGLGRQMLLVAGDGLDRLGLRHLRLPLSALARSDSETRDALLGHLLFQQVAQRRAGRRSIRPVALDRLRFFVGFLRLDGQGHDPVLAVDARELRLDLLARLQHGACVLDAIARDFGRANLSDHAAVELHRGALGVDLLHDALHDAALRVLRDEQRQRVLVELLHAERDSLALGIDREHDRLELLALLVVAHRLLAGHVPGEIGEMDETVDAARQPDEDAEVRDRLHLARDPIALLVVLGELGPRIGLALLQAQRDAPAILVDVEDHDLDLVTDLHDLVRIDVLVRPIHLGDVHQALDALLDLDEATVVGDVRHAAEETRTRRIAPRQVFPRIRAELLQAERYAIALAVELQDLDLELLAD